MKSVNYTEVPRLEPEDINRDKTTWRDGRCVSLDEGRHITLYVGHQEETVTGTTEEGETTERQAMKAFAIRLEKPLTKDKAINAAEMEAYGLASAMDVASLNAALSRKWRENINDKDVSDHDVFIRWVKAELDKTGLFAETSDNVDETRPTIGDVMALSRVVAESTEVTDAQALGMKRLYPEWKVGEAVTVGSKRNYNEDLWKCLQAHTTQAGWEPSLSTASLWARIDETHEGTEDDPIPYAPPMRIYNGKYYTQDGKTYKCTRDSGIPLSHNLSDLVGLYVSEVN